MQLPFLKQEAGWKNRYIPAEVSSPAQLLMFSQLFPITPHLAFLFAVNVIFITIFLQLPWLKNAKENWFLYSTTLHISNVHHQKERKKTSRCPMCDPGLYLQQNQLSLHLQLLLINEFLKWAKLWGTFHCVLYSVVIWSLKELQKKKSKINNQMQKHNVCFSCSGNTIIWRKRTISWLNCRTTHLVPFPRFASFIVYTTELIHL